MVPTTWNRNQEVGEARRRLPAELFHVSWSPSPLPLGSQMLSASFSFGCCGKRGWNGVRLNPKVGQRGIGPSKKWIRKLLVMPPSENQQRVGRGSSFLPS
jgi:hypothetical protein